MDIQLAPQTLLQTRYRILEQVGNGGFGSVYKAQDTHFQDRLVAVKELRYDHLPMEHRLAALNSFEREAALLADPDLRNTHLPAIFDRFQADGRSYLVMEFVEGETLEGYFDRLGTQRLPYETVFSYILQLCDVLQTLHTHEPPIIFRDLKPANIMRLRQVDFLYLIDFGIARLFKQGQNKDTEAFGSPGYAAPEQYGKAQSTPRTDIYGLGALFHQMLTGLDPSEEPFAFLPVASCVNVPQALSDFIQSMVAMDSDKRPANILVVRETVEGFAKDYQANGNRFIASQANAAPSSIPLPVFVQVAPSGPFEHPCTIESVAWSHDDQIVATRGSDGVLRLWGAKDGQLQAALDTSLSAMGRTKSGGVLAWSPKGKYLATAHPSETRIQVWELASGQVTTLYERHTENVHALAWSPDGKLIASGGQDQDIHLWDPLTGKLRQCLDRSSEGNLGTVSRIAWSPDAKHLAADGITFTGGLWGKEKRPAVSVWETDSTRPLTTHTHPGGEIATLTWSPDASQIASTDTCKPHVHVWFAPYGTLDAKLSAEGETRAVCWRGYYLFTATHEGKVCVWLVIKKQLVSTFQIFKTLRPIIEWSHGGTSLVFVTQDGAGLKRYDFV